MSLSLCGKWMYMCWPKCSVSYLSFIRKALTSSCFLGVMTIPPFLRYVVVNDLPGNACLSFCFVSVLSSCGFVLSIIIGIIRA